MLRAIVLSFSDILCCSVRSRNSLHKNKGHYAQPVTLVYNTKRLYHRFGHGLMILICSHLIVLASSAVSPAKLLSPSLSSLFLIRLVISKLIVRRKKKPTVVVRTKVLLMKNFILVYGVMGRDKDN